MTRLRFLAVLAAGILLPGCGLTPAVAWQGNVPHCPHCTLEVPMRSTACPRCGKEYRWTPTTCADCGGKGEKPCRACGGSGSQRVDCPNCTGGIVGYYGRFRSWVPIEGSASYGKEHGKEVTLAEWPAVKDRLRGWGPPGPQALYYRCPRCSDGSVTQTCGACGGSGRRKCSSCGGTGEFGK